MLPKILFYHQSIKSAFCCFAWYRYRKKCKYWTNNQYRISLSSGNTLAFGDSISFINAVLFWVVLALLQCRLKIPDCVMYFTNFYNFILLLLKQSLLCMYAITSMNEFVLFLLIHAQYQCKNKLLQIIWVDWNYMCKKEIKYEKKS
jgi:hypothetical protein